ncbi:MAG TPA: YraN family protein [Steroidobacteraceae bacterium]|nr:YraN family protein [Steroidobacteraceae bacterium]
MSKHGAPPVRQQIDRRAIGAAAEQLAAQLLTAAGLCVLTRNYRRRLGELDLVARDGDVLVIVEVRTRSTDAYGGGAASIDAIKRRRIVRATQLLLQQRTELARLPVRFDAVVVGALDSTTPRLEWIKHAFEA